MIDVDRPAEAPKSLSTTGSYKGDDVRDALLKAFHNKCYLCEGPFTHGQFNVEHLRPKHEFADQEQAWSNLFPAHGQSCNNRRIRWDGQKQGWPDEGMLDCAGGENVEGRLYQAITFPDRITPRIEFRAIDPNDGAACNTARELMYIHNGGEERRTKRYAEEITKAIRVQYVGALSTLIGFQSSQRAADLKRLEVCYLSKRSHYSAVVRTTLYNHIRRLNPETQTKLAPVLSLLAPKT